MKTAIAISHVCFEDAGTLEDAITARGLSFRYLQAGVDDLSPAKDADILVVLGAPIGVYEVDRYPFLKQDFAVIEAALARGKPIIGICLGSQLLAAGLGAGQVKTARSSRAMTCAILYKGRWSSGSCGAVKVWPGVSGRSVFSG